MQYMGSKAKLVKYLLPVMEAVRADRVWVEPFVGGANMLSEVTGTRIGYDIHKPLIALLSQLQSGWVPPTEVTKEMYYHIKTNQNTYPDFLVGFVGFLCSFGGKWWGGYASNTKNDNYAARGSRVLVKQAEKMADVEFRCGSYKDICIPDNSLIYCDPPYAGTTSYGDKLNHAELWGWCRQKTSEGHYVFVSEYAAPEDFICVAEIEHKTTLDKNSQYKRVERLFRVP